MNPARLYALAERWREEARLLRRHGAEPQAELVETHASELDEAVAGWWNEPLTSAQEVVRVLATCVGIEYNIYMGKALERAYCRTLKLLNLRDLSSETGRGYSTLMAYQAGTRRVTPEAGRELIRYLQGRAKRLTAAADALAAALDREEREDG